MSFLQNWDQTLLLWINKSLDNPVFDIVFPNITDLHFTFGFRYVFLPLVIVSLIFFQKTRGVFILFGLAVSLGIGDKLGGLAKHFWERPRPFNAGVEVIQRTTAGHFSFPSNHAINMFCAAFFLSTFFPRFRWLFLTIAFLIGFSRIYNGVHYPFDVFIGALLGSFVGILGSEVTSRLYRKFEEKRKRSHV